jgi:hypothetical protein
MNAAIEIKTMVSSATLFKAMVDGDISEYRDQCVFAMWMLRLDWVDLCLWAPDLPNPLLVIRINRDENEIQALEDDLIAFDKLVGEYEAKLRKRMAQPATDATPPWTDTYQSASSAATLTPSNVPAPKTTAPADVLAPSF